MISEIPLDVRALEPRAAYSVSRTLALEQLAERTAANLAPTGD
jgi:hypothetical protein